MHHHPVYLRPTVGHKTWESLGCSSQMGPVQIGNFTHIVNCFANVCRFHHVYIHQTADDMYLIKTSHINSENPEVRVRVRTHDPLLERQSIKPLAYHGKHIHSNKIIIVEHQSVNCRLNKNPVCTVCPVAVSMFKRYRELRL